MREPSPLHAYQTAALLLLASAGAAALLLAAAGRRPHETEELELLLGVTAWCVQVPPVAGREPSLAEEDLLEIGRRDARQRVLLRRTLFSRSAR